MSRNFRNTGLLLITVLLVSGCATVEDTAEPEIEIEEPEVEDIRITPDWYPEETLGELEGEQLIGYGRSLGSTEEWAFDNAERQAAANLRSWIDRQVEQARIVLAETDPEADEREFIIQLRNAVVTIDFDEALFSRESFEQEGVWHVAVRLEVPVESVLQRITENLAVNLELWEQMLEMEPLSRW